MTASLDVARTIYYGFQSMFADFQSATLGARSRFERRDWQGVQQAQSSRTEIYRSQVERVIPMLKQVGGDAVTDLAFWAFIRHDYSGLVCDIANAEIAETFYNSVMGQLFSHELVDDYYAFTRSSVAEGETIEALLCRHYPCTLGWKDVVEQVFTDVRFAVPFNDIEADKTYLVRTLNQRIDCSRFAWGALTLDTIAAPFYRNKGAYIVGRIRDKQRVISPFIIALMHKADGIYVDALLMDDAEVSALFSFTWAYFMVDSPVPSQLVNFLRSIQPHKPRHELYLSIGFRKHAKTELYRDIIEHMANTDDQFMEAPGIRGMVMLVFTLPSYDMVFKLIKDRFTPPKECSEALVKEKYALVTTHDRAGRMADTQEFNRMRLPMARFSEELLETLEALAPSKLRRDGDDIIIEHLYIERRMTPLNIFVEKAAEQDLNKVMKDYGKAIKDLAAANIFAGDMLLKNFGVTEQKRVVFYDYDEICYLTECQFRAIPEPQTPEQEMASTPWYDVGPDDVFPEEFRLFFAGSPKARRAFERYHRDLYSPDLWCEFQEQIRAGKVIDVYPYGFSRARV